MAVNMIIRRKGDYLDAELKRLRKEGTVVLKKLGAVSHRFGFYHSGAHTGQIVVVLTYPDLATYERAMKGMSEDADWKRIGGEVERLAPLQESYVTITEDQ
jgi:hypothetical protein